MFQLMFKVFFKKLGTKYDLIREVSRNFEWNIIE